VLPCFETLNRAWSKGSTQGGGASKLDRKGLWKFLEVGHPRAPAARATGALWGLSGATQSSTPCHHPNAPPARGGGGADGDGVASLELGTAAEARLCVGMARCPWCQEGALRLIAAITHGEVIRKILRHLKRAADPPPIAPACVRQEAFAWSSA